MSRSLSKERINIEFGPIVIGEFKFGTKKIRPTEPTLHITMSSTST